MEDFTILFSVGIFFGRQVSSSQRAKINERFIHSISHYSFFATNGYQALRSKKDLRKDKWPRGILYRLSSSKEKRDVRNESFYLPLTIDRSEKKLEKNSWKYISVQFYSLALFQVKSAGKNNFLLNCHFLYNLFDLTFTTPLLLNWGKRE